jgi:glycosyltransferase involved in cell wall biosynthesis
MNLTVAIPSRGEGPLVRASVESALRSASRFGGDAEVLVVVNGRDRAPALERLDSALLRVVFLDRANVARARNVAIEQARYDTVLFGDDGAACAESWCADLADPLRDPRYPVVTAPVRVPVRGPVTAFLNYQRFFDAPPVDATEARTVTGHCGLRRDLVPASVRFDEVNLPMVAEDVAFGHAARAAGIRIRWLAGMSPGLHLLPDRIGEVTERLTRYGRGTARVWVHDRGPAPQPPDMLALYRYLVSGRYTVFRRFREILPSGARAAFTLYDYLLDVSFLVGYLDELGAATGRPIVEVDHDGLGHAVGEIAGRAWHVLSAGDWADLPVDLTGLDAGTPTEDPLVAEVAKALPGYVRLAPGEPAAELRRAPDGRVPDGRAPDGRAPDGRVPDGAGAPAPRLDRLLDAWRELRGSGTPIDPDELDLRARGAGFDFRAACAAIERAANRRTR